MSPTFKALLIILLSICWALLIPGYVAYRAHDFTGRDFKNRISDSTILPRIRDVGGAEKYYKNGRPLVQPDNTVVKISFSGFIDTQLNYIWVSTFALLGIFIFVLYPGWLKKSNKKHLLAVIVMIFLLFDGPVWFRNSAIGQHGRTIYSYVNPDIDCWSYLLQELRVFTFALLFGILLVIGESLQTESALLIAQFNQEPTLELCVNFSLDFRERFSQWQRNILLIIVLFLPWTWFYWKNITFYSDARYFFAALVFHSFWVISICLFTLPIVRMRKQWRRLKTQMSLEYLQREKGDQIIHLDYLEPYPKFQFLASFVTTLVSLLLPFVQVFLKK
ncbi:hypothetical protein ACFGVR_15155 [Mucilaginibacter sp. AW1-3]